MLKAYNKSMNRKQRRAAKKQLSKESKGQVAKVNQAVQNMPTKCDECDMLFDNKNQNMLDSWKIAVYDDGPVHLVCPNCVPEDIKGERK